MFDAAAEEIAEGAARKADGRSAPRKRKLPVSWPNPLRSLTSRFIATLVAGVLCTSVAVTWISIQATESFLRDKIDHKFVTVLSDVRQRLLLWHSERELEIETLARSATLARAVGRPRDAASSSGAVRYLSLVLEQLPQLDALFVLDDEGELHAWVGPRRSLSKSLRVELAGIAEPSVGDLLEDELGRLHLASSPILGSRGERLGSVHAVIRDASFDDLLRSASLGDDGRILVVGSGHEVLAPRDARALRSHYHRALPEIGDGETVEQYQVDGETVVIGGSAAFSRFGWALVVEEPFADAFEPVVAIARRTAAINLAIVVLFSSIAYLMARSIVRPVRALSLAAGKIAVGGRDVAIPLVSSSDEIGVLSRALYAMTARLRLNQQELEAKNDELEQMAITDGLTGLYNHRYFQLQLEREMKRATRSGEALSLILIDIDDFKKLNDTHGHAVGDQVLARVAAAMRKATRESDMLARYGGEEFVLLSFQNTLECAGELAEKLRFAVSQVEIDPPAGSKHECIKVTVSVGVAGYQGDSSLFEEADRALYRAKARGKDCVVRSDEQ